MQVKGFAGRLELAVQILPFANPQVVEVLALAHPAECAAREVLLLLLQVVPQVQQPREVTVLVGEPSMLLVGLLLFVQGALARVLDGEGGDDDEHLSQRTVRFGLHHHPGHARVDGQLGDLAAVCRESLAWVRRLISRHDCLELLQKLDAVSDLA